MAEQDDLIEQMNIALEAFMEQYSTPFFLHSDVQDAAYQIAKKRGRQDIVQRIEKLRGDE